ncbi:ABC-2 transporter permease [Bacillus pseudomycoides]|uniref:ABC transporter substrate-binding protein n=1 Tax=Bacillus pseudomycoides TaxID=64104 RepID=A0A2C3Y099_9BACI|nr:ABC-2 transporter permease [Bacillus pseudomycoides]PDY49079.1 ABC transporter substrate-binding protein [Bacillus pseudomycoides]PEA85210.1 ABC transporter substrate-binding protein [Bacillus pseudomycoides]PED09800.1 ABC transporter substrate-binding protein [Bacillus pseudomycoides]PED72949.1 ABC transporter substrate-binding protein [Bacillus pseudomycoides]PEI45102.1 ABC transporter substrate-binding protein [Bacillus pseudomycoides]
MQQLIWKEFFLQRKIWPLYSLIPIYSLLRNPTEPLGIAVGCFFTCGMILFISLYFEDKSKVEKVLASLPVTRRDIVIAKYISNVFFIILGLALTYMIAILVNRLLNQNVHIPGYVIFSAGITAIIYSLVALPIKYMGGYSAVSILNIIIIFPLVGIIGFMCNVLGDKAIMLKVFHSENLIVVMGTIGVGVLVIYMVSVVFSIQMFREKEL